ncbi:hypothetical protein PITC_025030 [Penicillium italicum]|uniref:Uncharacterized protein n=1 Tax=Penicillium italicum TaxID=40296 RepID=A0A0A2LNU0_PENIT|nr:hypothetical protein PITC_025030 [Penicillium italicum]
MTSAWNDTVPFALVNDKNELESTDVLSTDSSSLPITLCCA